MQQMGKKLVCPLLYNHIALNNEGQRVFCCLSDYSSSYSGIKTIKDSDQDFQERLEKARQKFSQHQFPSECAICQSYEEKGIRSFREISSKLFEETTQTILHGGTPERIEYIDIKLGNTCNLKCRMCNPLASHALSEEFKEVYPDHPFSNTKPMEWYKQEDFLKQFSPYLSDLKVLQFTGGEPFINQEMWNFIDDLIAAGEAEHIHLKFNTNFTVLNEDILEKLKSFQNVSLLLSLDGTEKVFEYIRFPAKWNQITSHLEILNKTLENNNTIDVILTPSIQILNIFQLDEIIGITKPYSYLTKLVELNMVTQPNSYCVSNLPQSIKSELKVKILSEMNQMLSGIEKSDVLLAQLKDIIRLLDQPTDIEALREFVRTNQFFDQKRNQNLKDLLPEGWAEIILEEVSKV